MSERKPVIGIVGGIGSGKSAVAVSLARFGGRIIDADQLGHAALRQPEIKEQIVSRWGGDLLDEQGEIVRRRLGAIVFASETERQALEALVHPWIAGKIREQIAAAQADPDVRYILLDAAILLEAGWFRECDRLIFVEVPAGQRLERLRASRGWSAADLEARERAQLPLTEKAARADHILKNDGTLAELHQRVDDLVAGWPWLTRPVNDSRSLSGKCV